MRIISEEVQTHNNTLRPLAVCPLDSAVGTAANVSFVVSTKLAATAGPLSRHHLCPPPPGLGRHIHHQQPGWVRTAVHAINVTIQ